MATYTWTSSQVNPTVEDFIIIPEFKTNITEFDSGKRVRNSKWSTPRYKFKIKYRMPVEKANITAIKDFFIARKGAWESFLIYVPSLGTTHTVTFAQDMQSFDYFTEHLGRYGTVDFIEEI